MKSGAGPGGIGISPGPCGRWPCWWCCVPGPWRWRREKKACRPRSRGAAWPCSKPDVAWRPAERPGDSPPPLAHGSRGAADRPPDPGLVPLAPRASAPGQTLSLPEALLSFSRIIATVVLGCAVLRQLPGCRRRRPIGGHMPCMGGSASRYEYGHFS